MEPEVFDALLTFIHIGVNCEIQLMGRIAVGPGYYSYIAELGWAEFGVTAATIYCSCGNHCQPGSLVPVDSEFAEPA